MRLRSRRTCQAVSQSGSSRVELSLFWREMTDKPLVGAGKSLLKLNFRVPAKVIKLACIKELARGPIWLEPCCAENFSLKSSTTTL